MDVAVLARVLEATLESSTAIRNEAEEKLKAVSTAAMMRRLGTVNTGVEARHHP